MNEGMNAMMQALYANAAIVQTTLNGGRHGHIRMIMKPALSSYIRNSY